MGGESYGKGTTLPRLGGHLDCTFVHFYNPMSNRKPEAKAALSTSTGFIYPVEPFKNGV
jgi:hypothetical protein